MNCIKNQLACGNIIVDSKNCMATFTVSKFSDLFGKIIPFFSKYPLQGSKYFDFMDLCKIANIMLNKSHLTTEGLEEIRQIKFGMNTGRGDWGCLVFHPSRFPPSATAEGGAEGCQNAGDKNPAPSPDSPFPQRETGSGGGIFGRTLSKETKELIRQ